jgi:hypothetical protein
MSSDALKAIRRRKSTIRITLGLELREQGFKVAVVEGTSVLRGVATSRRPARWWRP